MDDWPGRVTAAQGQVGGAAGETAPLLSRLSAAWWAHEDDSHSSLIASAVHTALPRRMESLVRCLLDFLFCFGGSLGVFWPHHAACGIFIPRPGLEPRALGSESRESTTGSPGSSLDIF